MTTAKAVTHVQRAQAVAAAATAYAKAAAKGQPLGRLERRVIEKAEALLGGVIDHVPEKEVHNLPSNNPFDAHKPRHRRAQVEC